MSRRADLLPEWQAFLHQHSTFVSERSAKSTLYSRLYNLIDRQLAAREGMSYRITDAGREWLAHALPTQKADPRKALRDAVKRYNEQQKEILREQLSTMNPYKFEHLVAQLLEAMGYEEVEVTKASGDKGPVYRSAARRSALSQSHSRHADHDGKICRQMRGSSAVSGSRPYHAD